jgi:hypothetical protein
MWLKREKLLAGKGHAAIVSFAAFLAHSERD